MIGRPKEYFAYRDELKTRTDWLLEHGKYLEALFLLSAAVEHELDIAIELMEGWATHTMESRHLSFRMKEFREGQFPRGMTLGNKHRYLRVYLSAKTKRDIQLDEELGKFVALRNKASHDLSKRDLSQLEKDIKDSAIMISTMLVWLRSKRWDVERKLRRSAGQKSRRQR